MLVGVLYTNIAYSGVSPDSSAMLSPSDISIDPVDGDTVSTVYQKFALYNNICVCI